MLEKRQFKRFILKLPAEVRAGGAHLAGMTVRVSRKGFFVRSQKSFTVGTPVLVNLQLLDDTPCTVRGVVRYACCTGLAKRQNGMGIELEGRDTCYLNFVSSVERELDIS